MYKKIAIFIDAFIRDKNSEDIFIKNLIQLKKLNIPILLLSNTTIDKKIQEEVDYFIHDKIDLKFEKTYENYEMLRHYITFSDHSTIWFDAPYIQTYGLSVMVNHYKCVSILNSLGYDSVIKFEWDVFYDDRDLETIINTINNFKNGVYNKGYFQCSTPPPNNTRGPWVEGYLWMVDSKFFLENFPKLLCEDDYDNYLTNILKDRSFLTDARFLYSTLIKNFVDNKTVETDPSLCELKYSKALKTSPLNYPAPCTKTSIKYLFKTLKENEYVLFSYNISYINEENPNWETTNYRIKTKTQDINITHVVNTDCFQRHHITINQDEFPIELSVDNQTIIYNNKNEIVGTYT